MSHPFETILPALAAAGILFIGETIISYYQAWPDNHRNKFPYSVEKSLAFRNEPSDAARQQRTRQNRLIMHAPSF